MNAMMVIAMIGSVSPSDTAMLFANGRYAEAARDLDAQWQTGATPGVALARARAHFLSGNLPMAVVALHDGLRLAPYDLELQTDLRIVRDAVNYPEPLDPKNRLRPNATDTLRHRVAPLDTFVLAVGFALVAAFGFAKWYTIRHRWALLFIATGAIGFATAAVLFARIRTNVAPLPVVVVSETILREGNGHTYSSRVAEMLPRGAELRELAWRGGWIQVEIPGGAVGWVPLVAVIVPGATGMGDAHALRSAKPSRRG